ncbi:RNA methylase [Rhodotorula toruloides]|uniref:tRNA (guanine(10)-N(2))-methyltransferase n=1 Tax=Rhodotorula toruloides TaxID=5286 RepID=A0A511KDN0_RHOTO|nr:RNA methylase [Rhodotorula toruloides]
MTDVHETAGLASGHKLYILFSIQGPLEEFRLPEIESVAQLYNITFSWPVKPDYTRPYMLIGLPNDEAARKLGSRLVSVKHVWEFWATGETYEQLHERVKSAECREKWGKYAVDRDCRWKFTVAGHNRTIPLPHQVALVNTFSYMAFVGEIDLRNPLLEVGLFEEYTSDPLRGAKIREKRKEKGMAPGKKGKEKAVEEGDPEDTGGLKSVWLGRKICDTSRHLMDTFDLKKRAYIGTTSMEAEVSLLMANQALAAPGKWVYDPFVGTGSMLLTAAAFGAMTFGSDIDGRQIRGKKTSIRHSAEQYGVQGRIVDCYTFDMTQHPWRTGEIFDAIVTDPPYGVRAGAKRLGREEGAREVLPMIVPGREHEGYHHTYGSFPDYVPPSVGWPMEEVISTLVTFSLYLLRPGGRLVFFLPTDNAAYSDVDIPFIPGMRLVSNTSQSFGKWARRLITMEKTDAKEGEWKKALEGLDRGIRREGKKSTWEEEQEREKQVREDERRKPGHADFNRRYFAGFEEVKKGIKDLLVAQSGDVDLENAQ